jgi:LysM repeat protein
MSIAKKLKVSQYELLSANGITDPTKLQIGQKLTIPPQKAAAKTTPKSKKSDG